RAEASAERRADAVARAEADLRAQLDQLDQRDDALATDQREVQARRDRAHGLERDAQQRLAASRDELVARAGVAVGELMARMGQSLIDEAHARAAAALREVDQSAADPAYDREARRVMEIAATRYHHHYLTERAINNLRIGSELV